MIDRIEEQIAKKLADHFMYPFAQNIYQDIFRNFSHFPLDLKSIGMTGPGKTITYLSLVVETCLNHKEDDLDLQYAYVLDNLAKQVKPLLIQNPEVESFLGCILFFYHPAQIRNAFSQINVNGRFTDKEQYEYRLKKKTILIHAV